MSQGSTFTGRLYLGTSSSDPSLYSITGDPSVTPPVGITPNDGDLALSDNGKLYSYSGPVGGWKEIITGSAGVPSHASTHESGGSDELFLGGMLGELADPQKLAVRLNTGPNVGERPRINFIEGSNITLTVVDDAFSDEVQVTIASSGGGGGSVVGPPSSTDEGIVRFDGTTGDVVQNSILTIDDSGNLNMNNTGGLTPATTEIRFVDLTGQSYVALKGPNTVRWDPDNPIPPGPPPAPPFAMTLPDLDGKVNETWKYDGTGNFLWGRPVWHDDPAGGSLTGTYPNPGIAAGAVGTIQIGAAVISIDKLSADVVSNYLPDTSQKAALAGSAGTPGVSNTYITQEGGTVIGDMTFETQVTNIGPVIYEGTTTYIDPVTGNPVLETDPATGTTTYTDPTSPTPITSAVSPGRIILQNGPGLTVVNQTVGGSINVGGDSFSIVYDTAPAVQNVFLYSVDQSVRIDVALQADGSFLFREEIAPNVGELTMSAVGSATSPTAGSNLYSVYNSLPAPFRINASSLRFTGDLAPGNNAGLVGQVLVSQGPDTAPAWADAGQYFPSTASDWTDPTPPTPTGTGIVPAAVGEALDLLAAQNYARWLTLRTTRTDNFSGNLAGADLSLSVVLVDATSGNQVKVLPAAASYEGKYYTVKKIDSSLNTVSVLRSGTDLIDGQTAWVLSGRYSAVTVISDGNNWFVLDFQPTPGTLGQLLTSAGNGASPTWTSPTDFTNYTPLTASDWSTPTPPSPSGSGVVPSSIASALDVLAAQNLARWLNLRTTESRILSSNAILSDDSVSVILVDATIDNLTITLPDALTWQNKWLTVKKTDPTANTVSLFPGVGVLIDGAGTQTISYQYDAITVVSDGTNWSITDRIDSTPPAPVVSTDVSVSLNGSATNGAPTFIGGFYVPGAVTFSTNSRMYLGINAPGTIQVEVKNLVNSTVTNFSYVAATSGFFDVALGSATAFSSGWYNLTLTAVTAGTTVFARGLYLTAV